MRRSEAGAEHRQECLCHRELSRGATGVFIAAGFFVRIVRLFWSRGKFEVVMEMGVSGAFEFI